MNNFDVISTPTFSGFIAEVAAGGRAVRLCLGELYDPERYGSGGQTFTVPAKRITLDLQGFNDEDELIWLSRSLTVRWGDEGPAMSDDRGRYDGMNELRRIVLARLEALGYRVRPGRYVLPKDVVPLNGYFDCAEWYRNEQGRIRVREAGGE
jgi:hypothetical protein